jgi:hypothetical protein
MLATKIEIRRKPLVRAALRIASTANDPLTRAGHWR